MTTFTNAKALAEHQRQRAKNVTRSLQTAHGEVALKVKYLAYANLSGTFSTKELARLNHPYARRHLGKPSHPFLSAPLTPLPINVQTGQLRNSLRVFKRQAGNETRYTLQFVDPKAKFIISPEGTRYMIPRGFWESLQRLAAADARRIYLNAFRESQR